MELSPQLSQHRRQFIDLLIEMMPNKEQTNPEAIQDCEDLIDAFIKEVWVEAQDRAYEDWHGDTGM